MWIAGKISLLGFHQVEASSIDQLTQILQLWESYNVGTARLSSISILSIAKCQMDM